jgi:hemolysin III
MREPGSTLTHLPAFAAAIVGLVVLIVLTRHSVPGLVTMAVYGTSMVVLYGASSVYHWVVTTPEKTMIFKKVDHMAIYFLIAGSYTPVLYVGLDGAWRWATLGAIWGLSALGMVLKLWFIGLPRALTAVLYAILGWLAVIPFPALMKTLPTGAIVLIIAGGLAYTLGAFIYATKWPDLVPGRFGFHEVFHLFTVVGSAAHFVAIAVYIAPLAA